MGGGGEGRGVENHTRQGNRASGGALCPKSMLRCGAWAWLWRSLGTESIMSSQRPHPHPHWGGSMVQMSSVHRATEIFIGVVCLFSQLLGIMTCRKKKRFVQKIRIPEEQQKFIVSTQNQILMRSSVYEFSLQKIATLVKSTLVIP